MALFMALHVGFCDGGLSLGTAERLLALFYQLPGLSSALPSFERDAFACSQHNRGKEVLNFGTELLVNLIVRHALVRSVQLMRRQNKAIVAHHCTIGVTLLNSDTPEKIALNNHTRRRCSHMNDQPV